MSQVLQIAINVGTPLALLGLIVTLLFYARSRQLKHDERLLGLLPSDRRADQVDIWLTRYKLQVTDLPGEARERLVTTEMKNRYQLARYYTAVSAFVFVLCFLSAV